VQLPPSYSLASARAAGLTRSRLRGGRYVRLAHDLVIRVDDAIDRLEELRLIAGVLPVDAAYSHATAAAVFGAPIDAPRLHHVSLTPRRVLPQRNELVVHQRLLTDADVVEHRGLRLTSGPQTFLDLAARLSPEELVAVGDDLMRRGHLTAEAMTARLARADRVRGVVRARACAPLLSRHAMSRPESLVRYWLTMSRLPDPQEQLPVHDPWGRAVCHADLGYEEWKVALEYEGRQHAEGDQFDRDIDRYSLMAADGWLVLRFARRHLAASVVVERTSRALVSRGWRPPPRLR
jgi:very-short-patch-repair endonuclease